MKQTIKQRVHKRGTRKHGGKKGPRPPSPPPPPPPRDRGIAYEEPPDDYRDISPEEKKRSRSPKSRRSGSPKSRRSRR